MDKEPKLYNPRPLRRLCVRLLSGLATISMALAATVQTVEISGLWMPKIHAILGFMRLMFANLSPLDAGGFQTLGGV